MSLQVTVDTDASAELVTTANAKQWIKENYTAGSDTILTAEDTLIDALVKSARKLVENYCNSSFAQRTLTAWWDSLWTQREFHLPYGPVISISSVKTVDAEGSETTLTLNTDYFARGIKDKILTVNQVTSAPIIPLWDGSAIAQLKVTYISGYTTVPEDVVTAIKEIVAFYYINRGDELMEAGEMPAAAKLLLNPYRKLAI